jgi:hypothetical protein
LIRECHEKGDVWVFADTLERLRRDPETAEMFELVEEVLLGELSFEAYGRKFEAGFKVCLVSFKGQRQEPERGQGQ